MVGLEPTTIGLKVHCSTNWATPSLFSLGRVRTDDPLVNSQMLFHWATRESTKFLILARLPLLQYICFWCWFAFRVLKGIVHFAEPRIELGASGDEPNELTYTPLRDQIPRTGLEPILLWEKVPKTFASTISPPRHFGENQTWTGIQGLWNLCSTIKLSHLI